MNVFYDIAVPPAVARKEWREFARDESLVQSLGDVRFEAVTEERSQLAIQADEGALAIDAVVQRFRERLKRRGLV
ncbi:MAG: hypothetical protein JOZ85_15815 [Betaproteobacteria bacterium]|nr:hypothetical protein [Betaproteobacteria bacterium]